MPNLRQPSRLVVLRRSSMWKKGTGEEEPATGGPPGISATTASTVHGAFAAPELRPAGCAPAQGQCWLPVAPESAWSICSVTDTRGGGWRDSPLFKVGIVDVPRFRRDCGCAIFTRGDEWKVVL